MPVAVDELEAERKVSEELTTIIAEQNRRIRILEKALKPFADRVYSDNGDLTVTDTYLVTTDDYIRAHFALRPKT